jgi:hypothetical protein
MAVNSQVNWYTGTGVPPPNKYDVFSVLVHEFGHATGWGPNHLQGGGTCPVHVMCPTLGNGVTRRVLQSHDSHTFDNAYPGRGTGPVITFPDIPNSTQGGNNPRPL